MVPTSETRAVLLETPLERSDGPIPFGGFFESFGAFASQSGRQGYWLEQLRELRSRFSGADLCEGDTLTILAAISGSR
jgi:hypothetical protein